jgi:hypothetical protein
MGMFAEGFNYGRLVTIFVIALIAAIVLWVVKKYFSSDD